MKNEVDKSKKQSEEFNTKVIEILDEMSKPFTIMDDNGKTMHKEDFEKNNLNENEKILKELLDEAEKMI